MNTRIIIEDWKGEVEGGSVPDGWFVFMEMTEHIGIKFDKAEKCGHENVGMF